MGIWEWKRNRAARGQGSCIGAAGLQAAKNLAVALRRGARLIASSQSLRYEFFSHAAVSVHPPSPPRSARLSLRATCLPMFAFFTKPENHQRLLVLKIVIAGAVVGAASSVGMIYYKPWRLARLTEEARAAMGRGDFTEAALNMRRALQTVPGDVPACALMAEICDKAQSPDAVTWQGKVAELSGGSADALISWAAAAAKYRKFGVAEKALARVPEPARQRVDYLSTAGTVAFEARRYEEAARCHAAAARLDPGNPAHRQALADAQVRSGDLFTQDAGRRLLGELAGQPATALPALRALIASHEMTGEPNAALRESERVVEMRDHSFLDELTRVRLLHATGDERFTGALGALQARAVSNPREAGAMIVWMGNAGLAAEAVEWATNRAPTVGRLLDVRQALAGCYLTLGDWAAVLQVTQDGPWKQGEYIRHAYRSRALREQGSDRLARSEWNMAMTAALGRQDAIAWLSKIASKADWTDETEQALWAAIGNVPDPLWAVGSLGRHFHERKDTEALRRLAARYLAADPANENAQNDFAFLCLVTEKDVGRATVMAHELFKKHPANPAYVSTYALALHSAKRSADALKVLEALPASELEKPSIAAYYGIILTANGAVERAQKYLELGRQAQLLPEEIELLAKAAKTAAEEAGNPPVNHGASKPGRVNATPDEIR